MIHTAVILDNGESSGKENVTEVETGIIGIVRVIRGHIGIMEKNMETTIIGYVGIHSIASFCFLRFLWLPLVVLPDLKSNQKTCDTTLKKDSYSFQKKGTRNFRKHNPKLDKYVEI